ncbi:MAG TPA: 23S rRNA (cytosine(1962)-C(5))-methyltransferase RlmI [Desulfomicrobiaceae bacterium]|jgi:23S rRNA (cytosine1962-C5)-methyltransferase|nr:23S rRNA (cytosine(1962)-C(5))-methyltransferase RlmI [Desulfomicrobiaceae bacterium]
MPLILAPGREKSLRRRHPWIFAGAVARNTPTFAPGAVMDVCDAQGAWLARAGVSPASQIRARVWTFDPDEPVDAAFFLRRLHAAVARRRRLPDFTASTGWRMVFAESDGLPGLVVDVYGAVVVFQIVTAGMEAWREAVVAAMQAVFPDEVLVERSDAAVRGKEGLGPRGQVVRGSLPERVFFEEHGIRMEVDVLHGHKTGMYLDQRDNRQAVRRAASGARVLNCFCYTGGFGLAALAGGAAHVTQVDVSAPALALAKRHAEAHGWAAKVEHVEADVFAFLRAQVQAGARYDLIVLDPPKFIEAKAAIPRGCRGYKDINYWALRLLAPEGQLFTFSCSGLLEESLFQKVVADAALDAGVEARILARLTQAADHPVLTSFPEAAYLKGLHLMV